VLVGPLLPGTCYKRGMSALWVVAAFTGGGYANGRPLQKTQKAVLNAALWALPASCLVSAATVGALYWLHSGPLAYLWYLAPLALTVGYFAYTRTLDTPESAAQSGER
jgi:hypothetical protein